MISELKEISVKKLPLLLSLHPGFHQLVLEAMHMPFAKLDTLLLAGRTLVQLLL